MSNCPHILTIRRVGDDNASYCTVCGEKVMDVELRPCGDCLNCKKEYELGGPPSRLGYCTYHGGLVTLDMQATYHVSKGTCFRK